jgi:hypothetical protein
VRIAIEGQPHFFARSVFMPFRYVIDAKRRLVVTTAWGCVTFEEVKAHQNGLLSEPDFTPDFDQLLDATRLTTLDLSIDEAKTIARRPLFSRTSRRAWVSADPAIYGMGRLIAAYNEMSNAASQIALFYDLPSALKWLGLESEFLRNDDPSIADGGRS